jgi:IclR family pca regulon transcriptional regulator
VIHVARVEERRPLPDAVRVGTRLPAHATAVGRVLLADLPESELDAYLARPREAYTPLTIVETGALRERLRQVRVDGYDLSIEELHPGMIAAAVPIVVAGRAVAGLTVSSTTLRSREAALREEIVPALRDAAERIADAYRAANPGAYRTPPAAG